MFKQRILVSLCNLPSATGFPLICLINSSDGMSVFQKVSLGVPKLVDSATGIALDKDKVYVLCFSGGHFYISVLKQTDLSPIFVQELPEVKDGHSLTVYKNSLLVVSTGTDEVLKYDIQKDRVINPRSIWHASKKGMDTHHVNSIVELDSNLFVTAFGERLGDLWSSATNGYIHNITQDVRVKQGIYHPHTLSVRNNKLYYCDSTRKTFCSLYRTLFEVEGYARGSGWLSDDRVCVASSIGRKISKSTGLVANPADPGKAYGKSVVTVWDIITGKRLMEIDLSRFGPEIYDIVPIEEID